MGMTPVKIDDRTEVRVKDNVAYQDSWGLWCTLWRDGDRLVTAGEVRVADIDDETIEAAARGFAAGFDAEGGVRPGDLPLTIPVESIVAGALQHLRKIGEGLDRDEAYLLARLDSAPAKTRTRALLEAIEEAPNDDEIAIAKT